ncbi:phage tail spike protein [Neobacillus vireti]|uniref:phage tail spike protein n=1 Tax=Neobacillus vireti TaxID=220686 RepID=UPI002FFE41A5
MDQNLFLLNIDKTTVGVLSNRMPFSLPFYDDLQERSLDDMTDTLTFSIPANHPMAELVTVDKYILYPTFDKGYKLYKIKEVHETSDASGYIKEIYGEVSAQDDLIKSVVRPSTFKSATLAEVLTYILNGTDWDVGEVDDFGVQDYKIDDYYNALEALVTAVKAYGGELEFEYELLNNGSVIIGQKVSVYTQLGEQTNKFFTHGKDVIGVERIEDSSKLVTALIGVGKANDSGIPMTFASTNITSYIPTGYESPSGTDWVGSKKALETYSNGKHIFGVFKDDSAQSPIELFKNTLEALKKYERPLMTYKVSVALLERLAGYEHMSVRLGDSIVVQDKTVQPELYVQARVRKLSRSITNPKNDAVELGDYIPIIPTVNKKIAEIQNKIRAKEALWDEYTYKVEILSSNGLIFKNGKVSTVLTANVYRNKENITDWLKPEAFKWKKVDSQGNEDTVWGAANAGAGKSVIVSDKDVDSKATFTCDVDVTLMN